MVLPAEKAVESYQLTPVLIVPEAGGELLYDNMLHCISYDNDDNESTLTFRLSRSDPKADNIKEEMPVQFKGRNYRARTITIDEDFESGESFVEVYCERLWYDLIYAGQFDAQWVSATATALMTQAVSGSGWTVGQVDTASTIGWDTEAGTALNFLQQIAKIYGGYLVFDDQTKQVHLLSEANAGRDRGTSFTYYRGIRSATRKSDTSSLVTRLYGRNAEGVTIASANGGVPYVSNYSWTTAIRSAVYDFKAGMTPEAMLRYLNSILVARSTPNISYKFSVSGLMDRLDEVDRFEVLDTVFVQDKDFKNSVKSKVVSLTVDYLDLRRSKIELGNRMRSLSNSGNTTDPKNEPPALVRKPAVPTSVTTSSFVYFLPGGEPRAELSVTFVPAELGTDNQPIAITAHQLLGRRVVTPEENFKVIAQSPGSPHEITAQGFIPGDPWEFKVRAVASNGVASAASASVFHSFGSDTIAPPAPSKPILTSKLGTVTVKWDGKNNIGGEMPVDTAWIEVMQGPGPVGTSIASITAGEGNNFHVITGLPYNQPVTIWFRAVDTSGNVSANSVSETISTVPLVDTDLIGRVIADANIKLGAVKAELIAEGAVLTGKLADNAVSLAKLDTIVRDSIDSATSTATLANGRLTTSVSAPTLANGTGKPLGAIWYRFSGDTLLGTWRWNGSSWDQQAWGQDAIAAGAVVGSKLADLAITAVKIADNAIEAGKIAANAVTAREMVAGTITAASGIIADAAIGTAQIANLAVTNAQIASIDIGKATTGFLDAARIAAATITTAKLSIGNFTNLVDDPGFTRPLGEAWIPSTQAAASNISIVTTTGAPGLALRMSAASQTLRYHNANRFPVVAGEEYSVFFRVQNSMDAGLPVYIAWVDEAGTTTFSAVKNVLAGSSWTDYPLTWTAPVGAVTAYFSIAVASSATTGNAWLSKPLVSKRVTAELLVDGAVIARTIAASAVTADAIASRTITAVKIASNAITANEIAALTITAGEIASNAITSAKISALAIQAGHIAANAITADKIEAGAITAVKIDTDAITSTKISATAITSKHTITGAKFQTTATANRGIEITSAGLTAYNTSGVSTVFIDAASGGATFSGTIRNRVSGARIQINSSDTRAQIWFYTNTASAIPASITSDPSGEGLLLYGGSTSSGVRRASLQLYEQGANSTAGWFLGQIPTALSSVDPMGYIQYTTNTNLGIARNTDHYITIASTGTTHMTGVGVQVNGNFVVTGSKNFGMDHPTKPDKSLIHASTESPLNGVEYWSDGFVEVPASGVAVVDLPEYFEALTAADHRVAMLTAGSPAADLWAEPIADGKLVVHGAPYALFSWVVKARRIKLDENGIDTLAFMVEQDKLDDPEVPAYEPAVAQ